MTKYVCIQNYFITVYYKYMDNEHKRILLFLIGCMGSRFGTVYLSKNNSQLLPTIGKLAILPAIGFFVIYFGHLRKTGAEVFGENIWWDKLRPLHGLLWGIFSYYAIHGNTGAWKILLIDTLIGLFSFLKFHEFI